MAWLTPGPLFRKRSKWGFPRSPSRITTTQARFATSGRRQPEPTSPYSAASSSRLPREFTSCASTPPRLTTRKLGRYLGQFGVRDTEPSSALSDKSFTEALALVRQQGGISIAAHATSDNGLLRVLQGQARIKAWRSPDLVAVQIPGAVQDLREPDQQILLNRNSEYRRTHPVGTNLAVAAVNCKDVVTSGDLDRPSATCLIKMAEVSVEGLRQAFLDPGSRIRLNSQEKDAEGGAEMLALAWTGGFLDGTRVRLNPNLNVLVGGRGAGKSTVIESLRYVLDLSPVGEEAAKAHQGIVRQVLRNGTKVSLLVRRPSPGPPGLLDRTHGAEPSRSSGTNRAPPRISARATCCRWRRCTASTRFQNSRRAPRSGRNSSSVSWKRTNPPHNGKWRSCEVSKRPGAPSWMPIRSWPKSTIAWRDSPAWRKHWRASKKLESRNGYRNAAF